MFDLTRRRSSNGWTLHATPIELTGPYRAAAQLQVAVPEELRLFDADMTAQLPLHGDRDNAAAEDVLRRVAESAKEVAQASARLSRAIVKALQAGCSWRRIGEASGVPYQSLHRKFAEHGRWGGPNGWQGGR
ncbi:MAG TPA: hypothetical protein VN786_00410 [Acidimicrobiales bacterium]|nr:hypothetical protein [Acidimicrobiales bacterium]